MNIKKSIIVLLLLIIGSTATAQSNAGKATSASGKNNLLSDSIFSHLLLEEHLQVNDKQYFLSSFLDFNDDCGDKCLLISTSVVGVLNYQTADVSGKFGWLGRQPADTPNVTTVSEAAIHSVQLGLSGKIADNLAFYSEFLFNPSSSFSGDINTDEHRNGVQVRKAYGMWHSPYHRDSNQKFLLSLGKMNVPFGLVESFAPFTKSLVWHSFAALANGLKFGYRNQFNNRLQFQVDAMLVQGGAQFRSANTPVAGTNEPAQLNNLAWNLNLNYSLKAGSSIKVGTSYIKGSAYCQDYPVRHFDDCEQSNPATTVYLKFNQNALTAMFEITSTQDVWPGTHNPNNPEFSDFPATKVDSSVLALQYKLTDNDTISFENSQFSPGAELPVPWSEQEQVVFGWARHLSAGGKLFAEFIMVDGFVPLTHISGSPNGPMPHTTQSDSNAHSTVMLVGFNFVF